MFIFKAGILKPQFLGLTLSGGQSTQIGSCFSHNLEDQPIGCAVLYLKNSIAHFADAATPERFRGKGAQTALLLARFKEAITYGADLITARADFGSTSQKNMEKLDLRISYAKAFWKKF